MTHLFIAGSTGLVGALALRRALADPRVATVLAPTRGPLPPHPKLDNPRLDALLAEPASRWVADGAIVALGTTRAKAGSAEAFRAVDHDLVLAIAERLREAGSKRFALVSSVGADPRSRFLYPRTKGEVEAAVARLGFPSLTILRPGFLDGERTESRPVERFALKIMRALRPVLPRSAPLSSAETVAAILVDAAIGAPPGTRRLEPGDIARHRS